MYFVSFIVLDVVWHLCNYHTRCFASLLLSTSHSVTLDCRCSKQERSNILFKLSGSSVWNPTSLTLSMCRFYGRFLSRNSMVCMCQICKFQTIALHVFLMLSVLRYLYMSHNMGWYLFGLLRIWDLDRFRFLLL